MAADPVPRRWQYVLVSDAPDDLERERRAGEGVGGVLLQRTVADWSIEQVLRADGTWAGGGRLGEIKYRGAMYWTHDITVTRARQIAARWIEIGRVGGAPELAEFLPADLAEMLDDADAIRERAATVRDTAALPTGWTARARAALLDGTADVGSAWLAAGERIAIPAFAAWPVDADDAARQAVALQAFGNSAVVMLVAPDVRAERAGLPDGVAVAATADGVRAADRLYSAIRPRLLTTPTLDCAVLGGCDYDVAAGPRDTVEAVLGMSVAQAWQEFLAYARGDGMFEPRADLSGAVARYRRWGEEDV